MVTSFHLTHPTESLTTLLWVAFALALVLILFCAAPTHSQAASDVALAIEAQASTA